MQVEQAPSGPPQRPRLMSMVVVGGTKRTAPQPVRCLERSPQGTTGSSRTGVSVSLHPMSVKVERMRRQCRMHRLLPLSRLSMRPRA